MLERIKLEKFEIGTYSMKWLFGFAFDATFKLHINERIFICEPVCYDVRGHNPKKLLRKDFFKGKEIPAKEATAHNEAVKIQFEDGWVNIKSKV